jgi:hypothetical protein
MSKPPDSSVPGRALLVGLLALVAVAVHAAQPPQKAGEKPASQPAGSKSFVVKLPPGGKYVVSILEASAPPVAVTGDRATLEIPSGLPKFTLFVVDDQSGYAARRELTAKGLKPEVSLVPADLNLVHRVKLRLTGAQDKPVASATVSLTDAAKKTQRKTLDASRQGEIEFEDVAQGTAKLEILPSSAALTSKEVSITLNRGETVQSLAVPLPEVTAVVDVPPPANAAPAGAPGPSAPAAGNRPERPLTPADRGENPLGAFFSTLISFIILAAIIFGIYLFGKKQGWTIEGMMAKLGVQSQTAAAGPVGPGAATAPAPPPPVVADPNRCQFCGELKDPATGSCACTLVGQEGAPWAQPDFGAAPGPLYAPPSTFPGGPRLIGAAGIYMGDIFTLGGETVVGRDPGSSIPLDRDTTVSRRHARLTPDSGSYRIVDEGSSNGIYVNGARVSEALLHPGDEVSIGGTRFRFEV